MTAQPNVLEVTDGACEDILTATRRGVAERMADPYLTDHDRWVLRQFAAFLSRLAPNPHPRSMAAESAGPFASASPTSQSVTTRREVLR